MPMVKEQLVFWRILSLHVDAPKPTIEMIAPAPTEEEPNPAPVPTVVPQPKVATAEVGIWLSAEAYEAGENPMQVVRKTCDDTDPTLAALMAQAAAAVYEWLVTLPEFAGSAPS